MAAVQTYEKLVEAIGLRVQIVGYMAVQPKIQLADFVGGAGSHTLLCACGSHVIMVRISRCVRVNYHLGLAVYFATFSRKILLVTSANLRRLAFVTLG